jgi:hypothetical protein
VVDAKIMNIRQAIEDGLADANWANSRLQQLITEKQKLQHQRSTTKPPEIDMAVALAYKRDASRLFQQGDPAERKRLLRAWVEGVTLAPEKLEVEITYRVPNSVMNSLVAGVGFEPTTFGL